MLSSNLIIAPPLKIYEKSLIEIPKGVLKYYIKDKKIKTR